jgi:hypothetical protein
MSNDDTPPYEPTTPYYSTNPPASAGRTQRRGPLAARLAARALHAAPDTAVLPALDEKASDSDPLKSSSASGSGPIYTTDGASSDGAGPASMTFAALLREPDGVSQALRDIPDFGTSWESRADMLGACHDEYFQLNMRYNDARELLVEVDRRLTPLRQQQATAQRALRDLEAHIELHSRTELRSAYLGLADIELRVFRIEQEHDLLTSRIEELENFMGFLSRVIATVRAIPAEALDQPISVTDEADASGEGDFTEVELDADAAAELVARGEGELVDDVVDDATKGQSPSEPS